METEFVYFIPLLAQLFTVNRVTEVFKNAFAKWGPAVDDDVRHFATLIFSLLIGIVVVYFTSIPFDLPFSQNWSHEALVLIAGLVVGYGSNYAHMIEELVRRFAKPS